jgi:hypothetical protein
VLGAAASAGYLQAESAAAAAGPRKGEVNMPDDSSMPKLPRPSAAYIFGLRFHPGFTDESGEVIEEWLRRYKGALTIDDLLLRVTPHYEEISASNRTAFVAAVKEITSKHSQAVALDVLRLDQRSGRDTAMVVVWEGAVGETVKMLIEEQRQHDEQRLEEERKRAEQRRQAEMAVQQHRTEAQAQRKLESKCIFCGSSLGLFAKLLGVDHHFKCPDFSE